MKNPFDQFDGDGGFVNGDPNVNGVASPQTPAPVQPAVQSAPASNPFDQFGNASAPTDDGTVTVPDDGKQPVSRMSPEDEQQFQNLVAGGASADQLHAFQESKGFSDPHGQIEKIVAYRDGVNGKGAHPGYRPGLTYELPKVQTTGMDAFNDGAAQGGTFGSADEIHGFLNGVGAMLKGDSYTKAYDQTVDTDRARLGAEEQNNPYLSVAGNIVGGAVLPFGLEKSGLTAGMEGVALAARSDALAAGATPEAAKVIAARAVARRLSLEGGVGGATYGFNSGDGDVGQRLKNAAVSGVAGAALAPAIPYAASALGKVTGAVGRGAQSAYDLAGGSMANRDVSEALRPFVEENVPALAADVGGTGTKMATGFSNMTLGGIPLANAARKSVAAAQTLKEDIASRIGNPIRTLDGRSDTFGAGLTAQRGVKDVLGDGGVKETIGSGLYKAIPIDAGTDASTSNTKAALDGINSGLKSNPELSALIADPRMAAYQSAFTGKTNTVPTGILDANGNNITRNVTSGGKLNWGDLQSFRSYIGELAGRPTLQSDTSQSALKQLYAGLSDDMRQTAANQSPQALSSFTRANNYWRALQTRRDEVLKPLLGNDLSASGADAFRQIERWSSDTGNVAALGRTLRSMPEDAANDVRATLFDRLGMVSKGRQDETGTVWSPNDFMTHWSGLSSRAKANLFPSADYRQSIDNLVQIASRAKAAQAYGNVSKTGNVANGLVLLTGMFHNPLGTLPLAMGELGVGKLLGSARFANWLGSAVKKPNAGAVMAHINRLSSIARAEPAIAGDVLHLQQRLASAMSGANMPLAAQQAPDGATVTNGNNAQQQPTQQSAQP